MCNWVCVLNGLRNIYSSVLVSAPRNNCAVRCDAMGIHLPTKPRVQGRQRGRSIRVLVVDDERATVTALKTTPESEGHAVEGLPRDEVPP